MIDGKFFDQLFNHNIRTFDNIWKMPTSQGGDYTTGCLLDNNYFEKHYKLIATD